MSDEPVVAPDQLKKEHPGRWRFGAIASAVVLLLLVLGNHRDNTENYFLVGFAVVLILIVTADVVQRRYGIKR